MSKTSGNGHAGQPTTGESITGSGRDDRLIGTNGADTIDGRAGNDYLNGGAGDDKLTGGGGFDQFVLKNGGGHDIITDYQPNEDIFFTYGYVTNNAGDPVHDAAPHNLSIGEQIVTSEGHVLTIGEDAAGSITMTWDTGDSLTLQGVHASAVSSAALSFYPTDMGWQF